MAIPPDVLELAKAALDTAIKTYMAIRAQSNKIVPKPPPRPEPKYIERHDREDRDLVGRVNAHLQEGKLLTLTGAGGVGKTTIAKEVANRFFEKRIGGFKEGIVWISADGRPDFGLVSLVDNVLDQLVPEDQVEAIRRFPLEAKRELARRLLGDRKRCLLTLDNFETIPEEEQKAIVAYLAELPCPRLITSRKPLPKGEEIAVGPMTPEEARAFLKMRVEASAEPDRLKGLDLDQIAEMAGYNPMLMRWVVAQIEQAMRPQDVFDDTAHGKGKTIDRIFGRTFRLLGEGGQTALLALALFRPTASREALAAVCGFEDGKDRVNEAIRRLAAFDLLDTTVDPDRLGIVALTRRLTRARLAKDERTSPFIGRFVLYFVKYALDHPEVTKEDLDALEDELGNLLAALDYAYAAQDWETVMRIANAIAFPGLLDIRGYWDQAMKWGERAIDAARRIDAKWHIGRFSDGTASFHRQRGNYEEARSLYEVAIGVAKELGDDQGLAASLHNLGIVAQHQGHYQKAKELYNQSLEIKRSLGDQAGIASSLHQLGIIAQLQGHYQEAKDLFNQSLEIKRSLGDQAGIAKSLGQLGTIAQDQGNYQEAKDLYNQSLEIARTLGDQAGIAKSLGQLGALAEEIDDRNEATRLYREALEIFRRLGAPEAEMAQRDLARVTGEEQKE